MKPLIFVVFLIIISVACNSMFIHEQRTIVRPEYIQQYIKTAGHLNEDHRQAMQSGKPFIGMTLEEANMVMTLTDRSGKLDGKIFEARFNDSTGKRYILFFDRGTPNRVTMWNDFTDKDIKDITTFRNVNPCPPPALPNLR